MVTPSDFSLLLSILISPLLLTVSFSCLRVTECVLKEVHEVSFIAIKTPVSGLKTCTQWIRTSTFPVTNLYQRVPCANPCSTPIP